MVDFCDDCGSIIIGKKEEETPCPNCGKLKKTKTIQTFSQKIEKKQKTEIVDKNTADKIHTIVNDKCSKCGETKIYFWTKQMRAGDEPETQFFKCTKCNHQWRDYS